MDLIEELYNPPPNEHVRYPKMFVYRKHPNTNFFREVTLNQKWKWIQ